MGRERQALGVDRLSPRAAACGDAAANGEVPTRGNLADKKRRMGKSMRHRPEILI